MTGWAHALAHIPHRAPHLAVSAWADERHGHQHTLPGITSAVARVRKSTHLSWMRWERTSGAAAAEQPKAGGTRPSLAEHLWLSLTVLREKKKKKYI